MQKIHEVDRRRDGFIVGREIRLGNGDRWDFPYPRTRFRLSMDPDGPAEVAHPTRDSPSDFSVSFWEMRQQLIHSMNESEPKDHLGYARAIMPIACNLLTRNYDLKPEELRELLDVKLGDPANVDMWATIARLAIGGEAAFEEPESLPPEPADELEDEPVAAGTGGD